MGPSHPVGDVSNPANRARFVPAGAIANVPRAQLRLRALCQRRADGRVNIRVTALTVSAGVRVTSCQVKRSGV